jgi:predicted nucleic acid-binding protein
MQSLKGKRVYFDVNLFIYAVEPSDTMHSYFSTVSRLFEMAVSGEIQAMTSELALAEALVGAYKNKPLLVSLYEALLCNRAELTVYPINRDVLTAAALLRSQHKMALADAIHIATALNHQADFFITQDLRLQTPTGLPKLTLDSLQGI